MAKIGRPVVYQSDAERPVVLSLRIPPDLAKRPNGDAWLRRRSVAAVVREAIESFLAQQPAPGKSAKAKKAKV